MNRFKSHKPTGTRSPFAGCAILIAALLVMAFLIGFSTVTLFRQFNEIAKFTAEKPAPVAVEQVADQEAALNRLAERLEYFRQQLVGGGSATLELTPAEINLAISAYEAFRDLRGTLRLTAAEGDTLRLAISFPLNGKPRLARHGENGWITSTPRYLNGTLIARPALLKQEVVLQLDSIEVPGAQVPREFVERMSPYRIAERYLTDPVLGPAMAKLTDVRITAGKLVLSRVSGGAAAGAIGKRQVDRASRRHCLILGGVAGVLLMCAGIVWWLKRRAS